MPLDHKSNKRLKGKLFIAALVDKVFKALVDITIPKELNADLVKPA